MLLENSSERAAPAVRAKLTVLERHLHLFQPCVLVLCAAFEKVFLATQMRQPTRFRCRCRSQKKSLLPSDTEASASKSLFSVNISLKSVPPWHVTVAISAYISAPATRCCKIHSHQPCQNSFIFRFFLFYLVESDSEKKGHFSITTRFSVLLAPCEHSFPRLC